VGTDPERLIRANARLEGASIVANGFAGPPAGASLFAVAPALPAAANALSYLLSTVLLRRVRTTHARSAAPRSTLHDEIGAGLRWLRGQPILMTLAAVVGALNLATAAAPGLLVLVLQDEANAGTGAYATVLTISAVGALAGSVLAERCAGRVRPRSTLPAAVGIFAAGLLLIGTVPNLLVITTAFAAIGFAGAAWNVISVALRQRLIPAELLGRVNSAYRLVAYGTMPLGAVGGGALARAAGLRAPFLAGGLAVAAIVPVLVHALRRAGATSPRPGPRALGPPSPRTDM
jgi:predicted MFS family arabinose efflux permease